MPGVSGRRLELPDEVGHLLRALDVALEQHHVAGPELPDQGLDVAGGRQPLEAQYEPLPHSANEVLHAPSFFLTRALTCFPSTALPVAARAAIAAFMTFPMSFGEVAPVSSTAFATAASISTSEAPSGR